MSSPSLLVAFILFPLLSVLVQASLDEVWKAVAQAEHDISYSFCSTSLQSDPRSKADDTPALAVIAANISLANTTTTNLAIQTLLTNKTNSLNRQCLEICSAFYTQTISMLASSVDAIKSGNKVDAKAKLQKAMEGPYNCDAYFDEGCQPSSLCKNNEYATELIATALAITTLSGQS